ncbi:unnamed protein product [Amoebophrya sp. A25]|nr:unnamed protein product [Amoebophrya sp. A25]|eukprot:GSA25T00023986001.1
MSSSWSSWLLVFTSTLLSRAGLLMLAWTSKTFLLVHQEEFFAAAARMGGAGLFLEVDAQEQEDSRNLYMVGTPSSTPKGHQAQEEEVTPTIFAKPWQLVYESPEERKARTDQVASFSVKGQEVSRKFFIEDSAVLETRKAYPFQVVHPDYEDQDTNTSSTIRSRIFAASDEVMPYLPQHAAKMIADAARRSLLVSDVAGGAETEVDCSSALIPVGRRSRETDTTPRPGDDPTLLVHPAPPAPFSPSSAKIIRFHLFHNHDDEAEKRMMSIAEYVIRLQKWFKASPESFVLAFIYVQQVLIQSPLREQLFRRSQRLSIHRLLLAALTVSKKYNDDDALYVQSYYAKVGGVAVAELNRMEEDFLILLNWRLSVTGHAFKEFTNYVVKRTKLMTSCTSTTSSNADNSNSSAEEQQEKLGSVGLLGLATRRGSGAKLSI